MRGQGRAFERGGVPWIAYSQNGREHRESAAPAIMAEQLRKRRPLALEEKLIVTQKLLQQRLREVANDAIGLQAFVGPKAYKVAVGDLLDALEADLKLRQVGGLAGALSAIKRVRQAFGDSRVASITTETVDKYIESRLSEKDAPRPATVNREVGLLAQAFKLAVERRRIASAPKFRKLSEKGNARQGFFEAGAFAKTISALPEYLKGFAQFGYYSGWRKGEIASLLWSDVDMLGKTVRLRPEYSKTREGRTLALAGELWNLIRRQWALREFETGRKGHKVKHVSVFVFHRQCEPIANIRVAWRDACKAAGVEERLFHDLRRTFVRNAVRARVPERIVMGITGHRTRSMFDRYNIVCESDLREAVEQTETYLSNLAKPANEAASAEGNRKQEAIEIRVS